MLSFDGWMKILGEQRVTNDESVVALARLGEDDALRISKRQWDRSFRKQPGLVCGPGNELKPGGSAGPPRAGRPNRRRVAIGHPI